jgi:drug/metabolite transporter (DMT)-like permease
VYRLLLQPDKITRMIWGLLAVLSALLLGTYDFLKKTSLKENAVLPVLFISTAAGAVVFLPFILISYFSPATLQGTQWFVPAQSTTAHHLFMIKSLIVGTSWVFTYFAMKHLPLTIAGPIRSSGPLWTLVGALTFFGERLGMLQWVGLFLTLIFYYLYSLSGKKEGISFRSNKWIIFLTTGTVIGAISSLYDKYLVQHYDKMAMQAWYTLYMVPMMLIILLVFWVPIKSKTEKFQWRWTIPLIGICLAVADFVYFSALSYPESLIAIVSTLRRSSVVVSFTLGAVLFHEKNIKRKAILLGGILLGIIVVIYGGTVK